MADDAGRAFGPVIRTAADRWEMDFSLAPGHSAHVEWSHEPTAEELAVAHQAELKIAPGETMHGRVWNLGPIELFHFKDVGPPRWWLPRLYVVPVRRGLGLRIGWNFTAHEWSINRRRRGA